MISDPFLNPFLNPQGVVIIGASNDPIQLGYDLACNLMQSNYQRAIHIINIKGGESLGQPIHKSPADGCMVSS